MNSSDEASKIVQLVAAIISARKNNLIKSQVHLRPLIFSIMYMILFRDHLSRDEDEDEDYSGST